jgi:hypothetical protein
MNISPATKTMILEEMGRANADVHRVSRQYGIPVRIIRQLTGIARPTATFQERHGGFGRPELQQYIVSRTRVLRPWPDADAAALGCARVLYDAGIVEMCQGRDGDWIIQYSIPRLRQALKREPYFSAPVFA